MKKLLALVLVLAISASASAGIVDLQISGYGTTAGTVAAITPTDYLQMNVGDYAWVDIVYSGDPAMYSLDAYLPVTGPGALDLSTIVYAAGLDTSGLSGACTTFSDSGGDGVFLISLTGTGQTGVFASKLLFHCTGLGDANVDLLIDETGSHGGSYDGDFSDITNANVGAGVTFHQVPEPFTMALLSIGGLVALRRRR